MVLLMATRAAVDVACFVKFVCYALAGSTTLMVGPVAPMEGIRFHWRNSPQPYACAEGLSVADEFHEASPCVFVKSAGISIRR